MTHCPLAGASCRATGGNWGRRGLRQFQNTKFVMIDPGASKQDFWWFPYPREESYPGTR